MPSPLDSLEPSRYAARAWSWSCRLAPAGALIALVLSGGIGCESRERPTPDRDSVQTLDFHALQALNTDSLFRNTEPLHPVPLTEAQLARTRALQQTFSEVDTISLKTWIHNFEREFDVEGELRIWEGMAEAYHRYGVGRALTAGARSDVYRILLMRSSETDSVVLSRVMLTTLSLADAKDVLKLYTANPDPIRLIRTSPR